MFLSHQDLVDVSLECLLLFAMASAIWKVLWPTNIIRTLCNVNPQSKRMNATDTTKLECVVGYGNGADHYHSLPVNLLYRRQHQEFRSLWWL